MTSFSYRTECSEDTENCTQHTNTEGCTFNGFLVNY